MKATPPRRPRPQARRGQAGAAAHDAAQTAAAPVGSDPWETALAELWRSLRGARGAGLLTERELDAAGLELHALQRGLTGERRLVGGAYMDEGARLGAYLLFYWPVSRAQAHGMLRMASAAHPVPSYSRKPLRILDLGAGPGPCGIGAAEWALARGAEAGLSSRDITIVACDKSEAALACAGRLADAAGFRCEKVPSWRAGVDPVPQGPFDLVVLGHLLNELHAGADDRTQRRLAFLREAAARLSPEGSLLVLEPATFSSGRDMLELRDRLAAEGYGIAAPCFRDGPCPALAQEGQTCHSDFSWTPGPQLRALERRAGLDKSRVKSTAFVFRPQDTPEAGPPEEPPRYRVVSEPMLNKAGRLRLLLCGAEGRFPLSARVGEGNPGETTFAELGRSDAVVVENPMQRETGWALGADTILRRI